MLLRDVAINLGVVAESAKRFAELVYNFERRMVNDVIHKSYSATMTLGAIQQLVPSVCHSNTLLIHYIYLIDIVTRTQLPITETIATTFSNTEIDENTMVYVEDVGKLQDISTVVSSNEYL